MRKCKGRYYAVAVGYKEFELGYFHCFSVQYEELGGGIGVYPVAIVELPDGTIVEPLAEDIRFLDRPEGHNANSMRPAGADVLMPAT